MAAFPGSAPFTDPERAPSPRPAPSLLQVSPTHSRVRSKADPTQLTLETRVRGVRDYESS